MSDLVSRIREVVRAEVRTAELFAAPREVPPPLCDVDAEAELCSAALWGQADPRCFDDLRASDFYSVLLAHVWVACEGVLESGREATSTVVLAALGASGFSGPGLAEEVERIRLCQPYCSPETLQQRARRVRELSEARKLIERVERLAFDMRRGLPLPEARRALARLSGVE